MRRNTRSNQNIAYDDLDGISENDSTEETTEELSDNNLPEGLNDNKETNDSATTREKLAVFSLLFIIILQIITNKFEFFTPADALVTLTTFFRDNFKYIGNKFVNLAVIISDYISIKDIAISIYDIFKPLAELLVSPYNVFMGIFESVIENINKNIIAIITLVSIALIFSAIAQRNALERLKPVYIFETLHKYIKKIYNYVGEYLAAVSAIYKVFMLDKFIEDIIKICTPLFNLLFTPFEIIKSYLREVMKNDLITKRGTIITGSITLIGIFVYGYYYKHM